MINKVVSRGRKRTELKKAQVNKVFKLFSGSKKVKGIKDANRIAKEIGAPRLAVMRTLEGLGLRRYSPGSYSPSKP